MNTQLRTAALAVIALTLAACAGTRVATDYECFRDHPLLIPGDVPNARRAAREVLSLPVHPDLDDAALERVVHAVNTVAKAGA